MWLSDYVTMWPWCYSTSKSGKMTVLTNGYSALLLDSGPWPHESKQTDWTSMYVCNLVYVWSHDSIRPLQGECKPNRLKSPDVQYKCVLFSLLLHWSIEILNPAVNRILRNDSPLLLMLQLVCMYVCRMYVTITQFLAAIAALEVAMSVGRSVCLSLTTSLYSHYINTATLVK